MQTDRQDGSQSSEILPSPRRSYAWLWFGGALAGLLILAVGVGALIGSLARGEGQELPPPGWNLLMDEKFDRANQNHWELQGSASLVDNIYRWEAYPTEPSFIMDEPLSGPKIADMYIVTEIRHLDAADEGVYYGITFRSLYRDTRYLFEVYDTGEYDVGVMLNDEWETLVPMRESSAINKDGVNTLAVLAKGKSLDFYVNGTRVRHLVDKNIEKAGKSGLVFGSMDGSSSIVEVMSYKVYGP